MIENGLYDPCDSCPEPEACERCRFQIMVDKNTHDSNNLIRLRTENAKLKDQLKQAVAVIEVKN